MKTSLLKDDDMLLNLFLQKKLNAFNMTKENLWPWLSEKITTEGDDMLISIPLKKLNGIYYLGWAHVVKIFL